MCKLYLNGLVKQAHFIVNKPFTIHPLSLAEDTDGSACPYYIITGPLSALYTQTVYVSVFSHKL